MKVIFVMLVVVIGLVAVACSDESDETVADLVGSENATEVADILKEAVANAQNDSTGDPGNRKGESLACYTLGAMASSDPISTDYFDRIDSAIKSIGASGASAGNKDIREASEDLLEAWDTVIDASGVGAALTSEPIEKLTNACIKDYSDDFFAGFNN